MQTSSPLVAVVDPRLVQRRQRLYVTFFVACCVLFLATFVLTLAAPGTVRAWAMFAVALPMGLSLQLVRSFEASRDLRWVLGIEPDGLRVAFRIAPNGQLFLPWAAIDRLDTPLVLGARLLRVHLRPDAGSLLTGVLPRAQELIMRRGLRIGLVGTSLTPAAVLAAIGERSPRLRT